MLKTYEYRIYPNSEQSLYLAKTFGCTRFIYNKMLADKIYYYKDTGEMLKNTPAQYKKEFLWLRLPKVDKKIGADVGLRELAICSDGYRVPNPKRLRKSEKRIIDLQRSLSRKKKGSKNRIKQD